MILAIDIGNSDMVSVLYNQQGERTITDRRNSCKIADESVQFDYFTDFNKLFPVDQVSQIILSCVVPPVTELSEKILGQIYQEVTIFQLNPSRVPEMKSLLEVPNELGSDIIATSYGAYNKNNSITIVADLGSATKITVIDEHLVFYGGILMPGIGFQAKSIHQMIPHLPDVPIVKPSTVLRHDTVSCLQSGVVHGTLASVLELSNRIEKELDRPCQRIITGGLTNLFDQSDYFPFQYEEYLLTDGLYYLCKKWMKNS